MYKSVESNIPNEIILLRKGPDGNTQSGEGLAPLHSRNPS